MPLLSWRQHASGSLLQLLPAGMSEGSQQLFGKLHESVAVLQTWPGFEQLFSLLQRPKSVALAPAGFEQSKLPFTPLPQQSASF
jgi:hypothetical protein